MPWDLNRRDYPNRRKVVDVSFDGVGGWLYAWLVGRTVVFAFSHRTIACNDTNQTQSSIERQT
jgi:hypothetical protein